jgi:hypothetical protein
MKLSKALGIVFSLLVLGAVVFYFVQFGKGGEVNTEVNPESKDVANEEQVVDERSEEKVSRPVVEEVKVVEEKVEKPTTTPAVKTEEIAAVLSDEDLIKSYYSKLQEQKLEEAYALKYDTEKISFTKFQGWYGNVKTAVVSDITSKGNHKYQFTVDLKENNGVEEKYLVNMEVIDGLLKTTSSQKTWSNNSVEVYFDIVDGVRKIHVVKNGIDKLVTSVDENDNVYLGKLYDKHEISADKKYLIYRLMGNGYGSSDSHIYDIDAGREVHVFYDPDKYGFSKDGKYFYDCRGQNDYMGGEYLYVYSVPQFTKIFDFQAYFGDGVAVCDYYNSDTNDFIFVANSGSAKVFDFDSASLQ